MIWLPSRSGRIASSSSCSWSSAIRCLQPVVRPGQRRRLALVAGRAVRAGQLVQPLQQRAGVPHVAAHGRVGPLAAAVAVEAQVQLDQPGDVLHQLVGVLQLRHPRLGHLGADHLVVVEGDPAVRLEAPGLRLADVVQQRGQPQHQVGAVGLQVDGLLQHGQGVLVDVLVPEVLVALQPQRRQLGQHPVGQPGVDQQPQALARAGRTGSACSARPGPARRRRSRSGRPSPSSRPPPRGRPRSPAGRRTGPPASSAAGRRRRTPRGARGAQHPGGKVVQAAVGVDEVRPGSATAIAFTVKSRRTRSSSMVSP